MKATILLDDLTVIYEGEVREVIEVLAEFFEDGEEDREKSCPDCKHFETRLGGPPCSKCRDGDKFEPKPKGGDCEDCVHYQAIYVNKWPCLACSDGILNYEPKPEPQEFDDNHLICDTCCQKEAPPFAQGDLCGCGGMFQKRRGFEPNYRVHPAETFCDYLDAAGGINEHVAHHLSLAFGPSKDFWLNLWKNYAEAQNESNNGV